MPQCLRLSVSLRVETCNRCSETKNASLFPARLGTGRMLKRRMCKACRLIQDKITTDRWVAANPEKAKEIERRWGKKNNAARRILYATDPEYKKKMDAISDRYYAKHRDKILQKQRDQHRKSRQKMVALYGGMCVCCGEKNWEFLAIDHVNNDGAEDRRITKPSEYYKRFLTGIRLPGFQVLCHNCNSAKGYYGYCPHQKQKIKCS